MEKLISNFVVDGGWIIFVIFIVIILGSCKIKQDTDFR